MSHSMSVFGDQNQLFDLFQTIQSVSDFDLHCEDGRFRGTHECKKFFKMRLFFQKRERVDVKTH